eukprot:gene11522-2098_t
MHLTEQKDEEIGKTTSDNTCSTLLHSQVLELIRSGKAAQLDDKAVASLYTPEADLPARDTKADAKYTLREAHLDLLSKGAEAAATAGLDEDDTDAGVAPTSTSAALAAKKAFMSAMEDVDDVALGAAPLGLMKKVPSKQEKDLQAKEQKAYEASAPAQKLAKKAKDRQQMQDSMAAFWENLDTSDPKESFLKQYFTNQQWVDPTAAEFTLDPNEAKAMEDDEAAEDEFDYDQIILLPPSPIPSSLFPFLSPPPLLPSSPSSYPSSPLLISTFLLFTLLPLFACCSLLPSPALFPSPSRPLGMGGGVMSRPGGPGPQGYRPHGGGALWWDWG